MAQESPHKDQMESNNNDSISTPPPSSTSISMKGTSKAAYSGSAWLNFTRAIHSSATFTSYVDGITRFVAYLSIEQLEPLLTGPKELLENQILGFISAQKEQSLSTSIIRVSHVYSDNH
jgi:hypothetical protein